MKFEFIFKYLTGFWFLILSSYILLCLALEALDMILLSIYVGLTFSYFHSILLLLLYYFVFWF